MLKEFTINICEAYGDNEHTEVVYALCKDAAYSIALKSANQLGFDFPIITVTGR